MLRAPSPTLPRKRERGRGPILILFHGQPVSRHRQRPTRGWLRSETAPPLVAGEERESYDARLIEAGYKAGLIRSA
jgi:hypothetical protein